MKLKDIIDSPCGIRFMIDQMDLQSSCARRRLLGMSLMTSASEIERAYDVMRRFVDYLERVDRVKLDTLQFKLQGLKDITTTLRNLAQHSLLDDIELKLFSVSVGWA